MKRFNDENGFDEGYVYTIVQGPMDFLWIGTGSGIFRFDGSEFAQFTTEDSLAENFTYSSYKDEESGTVWFGHFEGGLTRLQGLNFESVLPDDALSSSIEDIGMDENGDLWLCSQRDGIVCLDTGTFKYKSFTGPFRDQTLMAICPVSKGRILVGTGEGLLLVEIRNEKIISSKSVANFPVTEVTEIQKRNGRNGFWIATKEEGIFLYTPDRLDGGPELQQFAGENLSGIYNAMSLYEGKDRKLWLGTFGKGFRIFNSGIISERVIPIQPVAEQDTSQEDIIRTIYQDKFGQVWLGTYGDGLICVAERPFALYGMGLDSLDGDQGGAPQDRTIHAIYEDRIGNFWFGTNNGLYEVSRDHAEDFGNQYTLGGQLNIPVLRRLSEKDGLPSDLVTSVAEDQSGQLWIGTRRDGVCKLSAARDSITPIFLSDLPLSNMVRKIVPERKSNRVWIGTQDGVFHYDDTDDSHDYYHTRSGMAHNNIFDIYIDSRDRVWFATHTNLVNYFEDERIETIDMTQPDESAPFITCITEDKDGNIWMGSEGFGVFRYELDSVGKGKSVQITDSLGLISNFCYQLNVDPFGNLWVTHRRGFSRYISRTHTVVSFLNGEQFSFEDNLVNSSFMDSQGNLWYATNEGVIRHYWTPSRTRISAPNIIITGIDVSGEEPLGPGGELPYGTYRLHVDFLGLTFLNQEMVVYQYKLEGRDSDWSEISKDNWATLQGLKDGDYTFHVRARSIFGNWNEQPAKFSFSIAPPFWKTWWFRILMMLVLAGIIFLYVRYRVYRLNKEKAELEEKVAERTQELEGQKKKLELVNLELEKLSLVASETDNAVFIVDKDGHLEYVNPGFTRLTGYTFEEIKALQHGKSFLTLSSNSEIGKLIHEVVKSNTSIQYESSLPSKVGEQIWVISTLTPILDEQGELRKIVIIDSNITERKEAEEQVKKVNEKLEHLVEVRTQALAQANEQLQQENLEHIKTAEQLKATNEELDSFVYRASHDLKGPLASLLGLVNIAKAELTENETALNYLNLMEQRGQRLDSILVDLIEATQVKQTKVELKRFRPYEIVEHIVELAQNKVECQGTEFILEVDPKLECVSDRKLVRSILQNYIENSAKYRDPNKSQSTSTTRVILNNGHLEIHVTDNGVGIPESAQERVFEMFYRGTNSVSGSGLGLYIVKQAVDKLGGSVQMHSTPGVGTTFSAIVPNHKLS